MRPPIFGRKICRSSANYFARIIVRTYALTGKIITHDREVFSRIAYTRRRKICRSSANDIARIYPYERAQNIIDARKIFACAYTRMGANIIRVQAYIYKVFL